MKIFENFKLGKLNLKNRLALAPMTRISASSDGIPSEKMLSYYESFAKGGFGLIITEGTYIDNKYSQTYKFQPGIVYPDHIDSWANIATAVKKHGAKIIMQIQHSGALSQGNSFVDITLAPSVVHPKGAQLDFYNGNGPYEVPKEATKLEILEIISSFAKAAKNAQASGFDGVEIHGANGYFLDQFLTDYTNQRNDEYGGTIENRLRIYKEVISAVKKEVTEGFIVGIRISQSKVNDYCHKWIDEEEAEYIFKSLENYGVEYLHITEFSALQNAFEVSRYKKGSQTDSLIQLAKKYTDLPVLANGSINSESTINKILESGSADLVSIGKTALANHDFPVKIKNGKSLNLFDADKILRPMADIKDFEIN